VVRPVRGVQLELRPENYRIAEVLPIVKTKNGVF